MDIALYQPEIPPNTGNIGRLCYCTGSKLHIIGKPAFSLDEASVRRAGLDYWQKLGVKLHSDWPSFKSAFSIGSNKAISNMNKIDKTQQVSSSLGNLTISRKILLFSRFAQHLYTEHSFTDSDLLVFGSETKGLAKEIVEEVQQENPAHILRIPLRSSVRSLNLSNAVAIVLFEALRQLSFPQLALEK